jgi:hypothetical protein
MGEEEAGGRHTECACYGRARGRRTAHGVCLLRGKKLEADGTRSVPATGEEEGGGRHTECAVRGRKMKRATAHGVCLLRGVLG